MLRSRCISMKSDAKFINLGKNGLRVSPLGLGCMGMSEWYGATNDAESLKTLHRAYELGVNHFDTADCYGANGHNEQLLAKAIKDFERDKIVIATKCGFERGAGDAGFTINNSPEYIKKCCDDSLKRLNVDYIDLFYLHRRNPDTPIELSMQALSELVKAGKIRNIGLSEVSAKTIAEAHAIHPLAAIQSEYSLWSRDPEKEVIPLCKTLGIGFVAFSPLGNGFLSGKVRSLDPLHANDVRRYLPRFQEENLAHNLFLVQLLEKIAKDRNRTPAQIALAWVLAQDNHITAIPGTKSTTYLEENLKALNIMLSPVELLGIESKMLFNSVSGPRMSEEFLKFSDN